MNWLDIILAIVLLAGAFRGYKEGFVMEVISFFAIILGVLGGFKLMGWGIAVLHSRFENIESVILPYLAFALVFIIIVVVVSLLGRLIKMSINNSFLGGIDQSAGGLIGLLKTSFMISVVLWIVDSLTIHLPRQWVENSLLYPFLADFAPTIAQIIGFVFPSFKDIF